MHVRQCFKILPNVSAIINFNAMIIIFPKFDISTAFCYNVVHIFIFYSLKIGGWTRPIWSSGSPAQSTLIPVCNAQLKTSLTRRDSLSEFIMLIKRLMLRSDQLSNAPSQMGHNWWLSRIIVNTIIVNRIMNFRFTSMCHLSLVFAAVKIA